jgi:hypothetical protein
MSKLSIGSRASTNAARRDTSLKNSEGIVVGSVLAAAILLSLACICFWAFLRGRWRSGESKENQREGSTRGKQKEMDDDMVALRVHDGSGRCSMVELAELAVPTRTVPQTRIESDYSIADMGELPGSFDLWRPLPVEGRLNSHPPTPLSPLTPATNTWKAPDDWEAAVKCGYITQLAAHCSDIVDVSEELDGEQVSKGDRARPMHALGYDKSEGKDLAGCDEIGVAR